MTIVKGDGGGIIFRADASAGSFYYFHIDTKGLYALEIYKGYNPLPKIIGGSSSAIKIGLNQTNLIGVVANGDELRLFVNLQPIGIVNDKTYTQGQIGVIAERSISNLTDVVFSNAQVRSL